MAFGVDAQVMADGGFDHEAPLVRVRIGTPADVHDVMAVAIMACEENSFATANPIKLLADIWPALNLDHGAVGIIGELGEQIEGVVLLRVGHIWYSDDALLEERAVFVHPQFRQAKGGRAARLCEFSKRMADELGLPLTIGVLSNDRTKAKVRMYSRIMGEPSGAYWLYGVKTGGHDIQPVAREAE